MKRPMKLFVLLSLAMVILSSLNATWITSAASKSPQNSHELETQDVEEQTITGGITTTVTIPVIGLILSDTSGSESESGSSSSSGSSKIYPPDTGNNSNVLVFVAAGLISSIIILFLCLKREGESDETFKA